MLDEVDLIHMNGRIYNSRIGRFLQADTVVQFPGDLQSYNRYSYVLNNPLSYTDPSGHGIVSDLIAFGFLIAGQPYIAIAIAGFGGVAEARINGASWDQAIISGVSSAAFFAAGSALGPGLGIPDSGLEGAAATWGEWGTNLAGFAAVMGTIGGVTAELQGGNFGNGFVTAGASALVGGATGLIPFGTGRLAFAEHVLVAAVVGGTFSELTGGKFANGALTAGFTALAYQAVGAAAGRTKPDPEAKGTGTNSTEGNLPPGVRLAGEVNADAIAQARRARRMYVAQQNGFLPGTVPGDPPAPGAALLGDSMAAALGISAAAGAGVVAVGAAPEIAAAAKSPYGQANIRDFTGNLGRGFAEGQEAAYSGPAGGTPGAYVGYGIGYAAGLSQSTLATGIRNLLGP